MSSCHFSVVFRQTMGIPFAAYARRFRLARSTSMLLETDQSLEAIAAACGFASASHFHRAFFRVYRQSPTEFRRHRTLGDDESRPC
ncbi:MAG: helix-turn-helix domain-containing protein [Anaerolineae bacterium]|nr:helix-turn-helix domain-containing protein [Anaerolineae bacterium]NIN95340.1 helix-turn-helix domain-containing protein [Anaerolineae bacterium]NIQ78316.1 helix-turn-helix domain-containing protein [Anaerolineae bacterium]